MEGHIKSMSGTVLEKSEPEKELKGDDTQSKEVCMNGILN